MSFDLRSVKEFFDRQDNYSRRKGLVHPEEDTQILRFIGALNRQGLIVVEVGGGSGYLLDLINQQSELDLMVNCELSWEAYSSQINEEIELVGSNGLYLPLSDASADILLAKNLLHHLVGSTRSQSVALAKRATSEFRRVLKPGGFLILVEQYNRHKLYSAIIFYLSRLFSAFKIGIERYGVNAGVIVSFLTPDEITAILLEQGYLIYKTFSNEIPVPFLFRASLLMGDIGRLTNIVEKQTSQDLGQ